MVLIHYNTNPSIKVNDLIETSHSFSLKIKMNAAVGGKVDANRHRKSGERQRKSGRDTNIIDDKQSMVR